MKPQYKRVNREWKNIKAKKTSPDFKNIIDNIIKELYPNSKSGYQAIIKVFSKGRLDKVKKIDKIKKFTDKNNKKNLKIATPILFCWKY